MSNRNLKRFKTKEKEENTPKRKTKTAILLTASLICLATLLLYFGLPCVIRLFRPRETQPTQEYHFYPEDYEEDIMKDRQYLQKDRSFYFEDPTAGTTVSFDPDHPTNIPDEQKLPVEILSNYVRYAIAGEVEKLNHLFSEKYFNDGFEAKAEFTPQKIYEIKFTYHHSDTLTEESGSWKQWVYWVEYKIYKNNGSFRNDMGSDCSRKEYFVITYRDGTVEIDGVTPYQIRMG